MVTVEEVLADRAIVAYLNRLVGEEGIELLRRFPKEGEFSDEDLAAETGINLNSVRHTLYTLYEKRLAEYRRIKNNETGWLTYLWQIRVDNIHATIIEDMKMILEKLRIREKYEEENDFYKCSECHAILTFNRVMDAEFTCPECGGPIEHYDNSPILNALKRRIELIQQSIAQE